MAITIKQKPRYKLIPAGQEHIVHSVYDAAVITATPAKHKIKYTCQVFMDTGSMSLSQTITNRVSYLKVNANEQGYGIFDIAPIVGNYVSADYEGGNVYNSGAGLSSFSEYQTVPFDERLPHSIHLIDKFCANQNSVRYCKLLFGIEYADSATGDVTHYAQDVPSEVMIIFNGVLYDTDMLKGSITTGKFGYQITQEELLPRNTSSSFLSSAPTTQYIREDDFATIGFFTQLEQAEIGAWTEVAPSGTVKAVKALKIAYYNEDGSALGSTITNNLQLAVGGHFGHLNDSNTKIQYFGVGTKNQTNSGAAPPAGWHRYDVWLTDDQVNQISQKYSYYKQEESCKGFETVRLSWLNKWGTWDYYNFTQKNIRTLRTTRKAYKQLSGEWNKPYFQLSGHKGGMKNYNTTINESVTLNTNYITEEEGTWLEQLFISNDVYMITDSPLTENVTGTIRRYVQPVRITSEEMIRKTKANDKLIQYTFEVETNRTKKSHKL